MSDIYLVTDHILFNFVPHLVIPFLFGMLLIGMFTRYVRNIDGF